MQSRLTLIFDSIQEQGLPNHSRKVTDPWPETLNAPPSREGLDALMASGSAQPSLPEFAGDIRGLGTNVIVVDLRQESHALLGEHPVSWYGEKNWANKGTTLTEVLADEVGRIKSLAVAGSATVSRVYAKDENGRLTTVRVEDLCHERAQSEESACSFMALGYFRIPVTDHSRPADTDVDRFIQFVRVLAPGAWLHFHCHAGDGRTTTFMLLYDMLLNARVLGLEELAARQHLLGGVDVLHSPHSGWKGELYNERADFVRRFYEYAQAKDFKAVLWSAR